MFKEKGVTYCVTRRDICDESEDQEYIGNES